MTDRATLMALAERCETAEGPDRMLDAEIFAAVKGGGWKAQVPGVCVRNSMSWGNYQSTGCPPFTGDVSQSLHIIPRNWQWLAGNHPHPNAACFPTDERYTTSSGEDDDGPWPKTVALALCAAALRARAMEAEK